MPSLRRLLAALEDTLSTYVNQGYHTTILRNFNFRDINWKSNPPAAATATSSALVERPIAWNMAQIVPKPTKRHSFLDLIITTTSSIFDSYHLLPPVNKSNHDIVICISNINSSRCSIQSTAVKKCIYYGAL